MAPMRAHIFDQLNRMETYREVSFWYGGGNQRELFYVEECDQLAEENDNFEWHIALSEQNLEDRGGVTGFIHDVLYEEYLKDHPAPEHFECYRCGLPVMNSVVIQMVQDLGVEPENIFLDDLGG